MLVVAGGEQRQDRWRGRLRRCHPRSTSCWSTTQHGPLRQRLADAVASAVLAGHGGSRPRPRDDRHGEARGAVRWGGRRGAATEQVLETVARIDLRCIQTPQGFDRAVLAKAHAAAEDAATDDAGLVERLGLPVVVVAGSADAFKITRPIDLLIAEAVLRERRDRDVT